MFASCCDRPRAADLRKLNGICSDIARPPRTSTVWPALTAALEPFDVVAPTIFGTIMRCRCAAIAFGWDDGLDACGFDLGTDRVGIVAFVSQQCLDPFGEHAEQRAKTLRVVRLARCQHEAEGAALDVAAGVELCTEAAARSAKRYDKTRESYLGFVAIASIKLWIPFVHVA